mgnify:CR=1 FL=1
MAIYDNPFTAGAGADAASQARIAQANAIWNASIAGRTPTSSTPSLGQNTGKIPFGADPIARSNAGPITRFAEGVYHPQEFYPQWRQIYEEQKARAAAMPRPNLPAGTPWQQYKPEKLVDMGKEAFENLERYPDMYEPSEIPLAPFVPPKPLTVADVMSQQQSNPDYWRQNFPGAMAAEGRIQQTTEPGVEPVGQPSGGPKFGQERYFEPRQTPFQTEPLPLSEDALRRKLAEANAAAGGIVSGQPLGQPPVQPDTGLPQLTGNIKPGDVVEDAKGNPFVLRVESDGRQILVPVGHGESPTMPIARLGTFATNQAKQVSASQNQSAQARTKAEAFEASKIDIDPSMASIYAEYGIEAPGRVTSQQWAQLNAVLKYKMDEKIKLEANAIRLADIERKKTDDENERKRLDRQYALNMEQFVNTINQQRYAQANVEWSQKNQVEQQRQARVAKERQQYLKYILDAQNQAIQAGESEAKVQSLRYQQEGNAFNQALAEREMRLRELQSPFRNLGGGQVSRVNPFYQR